jgi:uncharacterized protein (TIGR02099 family)
MTAAHAETSRNLPAWLGRLPVGRTLRVLGWTFLAVWVMFAALLVTLRYAVLPGIMRYHADIEAKVSTAIGLPVRIGRIEGYWSGINPGLVLHGVVLQDQQGRDALSLEQIDARLSWQTLWKFRPILDLLAIDNPVLQLRRDAAGHISIAGISIEGEADPRIPETILAQRHIRIRNATLLWQDEQRQAPPLVLREVQFGLDNSGRIHKFGLTALPPEGLASRIDLRGEWHSKWREQAIEGLRQGRGSLFAELDYADLATWQRWVEYPVSLPQGRGALRLWLTQDNDGVNLTTDVALSDVRLRLAPSLPELDLLKLRGRLVLADLAGHRAVEARALELATRDGLRIEPTNFHVDWRQSDNGRNVGRLDADRVDLRVFSELAGHLPLDAHTRKLLATLEPQGKMSGVQASWDAQDGVLQKYGLRAAFDRLGLRPWQQIPGGSGLSGKIDVNERNGRLQLDASRLALDLPKVFSEPHVAFDTLQTQLRWSIGKDATDFHIDRLAFAAPDAAGEASGSYRLQGDGAGIIDLTASLSRAQGAAVWRYMPLVVSADARNWLKRGIVGGTASDAHLILKGDLRDFPFRDPAKGQFLVTAKAHNTRIDYADGWPPIEGVDADLRFGIGMQVEASRGRIFGTELGPVKVTIPDFDVADEQLIVKGMVRGPTAEFLRFIDRSPVSKMIDGFTEDLRATGNGVLDLSFAMPLRHVDDTKLDGRYRFEGNQIVFAPGMPPISDVAGLLEFTGSGIEARAITGRMLGQPLHLSARNQGDKVSVQVSGGASVAELRKLYPSPLFDNLSGTASWKGEVRVRKKTAELLIDSDLLGISSSLPAPFNKSATQTLPLHLEKAALGDGSGREMLRVRLGKVLEAQLQNRPNGKQMQLERGNIAIGEPAVLPDRGLTVAVTLPQVVFDDWQALASAGDSTGGTPALSRLTLKTPRLLAFGRQFGNVTLQAKPDGAVWQMQVNADEAAGTLSWNGTGKGFVRADLKRLKLVGQETPPQDATRDLINSLPGMDVHVGDFAIGERRFGQLELKAANERGVWRMQRIALTNPDGALTGSGVWDSVGSHTTQLDFQLEAKDIGHLLDRLGYVNAVKHGTATLKGQLSWQGTPTDLDYATLSGALTVNAAKGQFAKLEPGVGKLLGLLSLQALPRRITLDFRDIFSGGLAFDSIDAHLAVHNGIMRTTDDLHIASPAAQILMQGETDLQKETQNLKVSVQPELGGAAALGAAVVVNPLVGAAALVAQKVLQNPLDKMFGFQYQVTGTWDDPQVDKVSEAAVRERK